MWGRVVRKGPGVMWHNDDFIGGRVVREEVLVYCDRRMTLLWGRVVRKGPGVM